MDNREILMTALEQSAREMNCRAADFLSDRNVATPLELGADARKYYREPVSFNLVSYGNNVVAAAKPEYREIVEEYIGRFEFYHCFETPNLHWLNSRLEEKGQKVCFMAEYYLPDLARLRPLDCGFELRFLGQPDFENLYPSGNPAAQMPRMGGCPGTEEVSHPQWGNALCADRRELDVLGVGAYDGGCLVGLAGASADCDTMWQIGVDVLPGYRRRGIASALTSRLALEILERGRVPFYCSAWSNIRSVRNAVKSGFVPAWAEMTGKPSGYVDQMNESEGQGNGSL